MPNIVDGSGLRSEPSMLEVQIMEGSGIPSRKFCTWKQQPAGKRAHSGAPELRLTISRTPGIVHRFQGSFYKYTRSFSRNEVPRPSYSTSMYSTVHLYGIRPRLISDPLLITNTPSPLMPLVQSVKYPYCEDIESIVANIVIFLSSRQS